MANSMNTAKERTLPASRRLPPKKRASPISEGPAGSATAGHFAFARLHALVGAICQTRGRAHLFSEAAYSDSSGRKPVERRLEHLFSGRCRSAGVFRKMPVEKAICGSYSDQLNEAAGLIYAFTRDKNAMGMIAEVAGSKNAPSVSQALGKVGVAIDVLKAESSLPEGSPMSFRPEPRCAQA
jgi:hypothetical protein